MEHLVDGLINIEKEIRKKIISGLNPVGRKLVFDRIPTLTDLLRLDLIKDYDERVKLRSEYINSNPDKVLWDFAEFHPCLIYSDTNSKESINFTNVKISTEGNVVTFTGVNQRLAINCSKDFDCKTYVRVSIAGKFYTVHRLMGCTFIPIPEKYNLNKITQLLTNHKDLNVINNKIYNLEWTDNSGNIRHAQDNGAKLVGEDYYKTKPILMEVVADNRFKGRQFVLQGLEHCKEFGFEYKSLTYVIKGEKKHNFGHACSFIPLEDVEKYHLGMPDDIKELYNKNINYFSMDIIPIVGTVLTGVFEGLEFSMFGATEINEHFVQANVLKVCKGERKSHRNCSWRQVSLEEGIKLHGLLTDEVLKTLQ